MSLEKIVRSFGDNVRRGHEQSRALSESTRNRLVWFVGIAAFALLNGKSIWESVANRQMEGIEIFLLSIPWLLSVLFSMVTHFMVDHSEIIQNKYYNNKLAEIELHKASIADGEASIEEFSFIVHDENLEIKNLKSNADKWAKIVNLFEKLTLCFLVLGFIWSILLPLTFK